MMVEVVDIKEVDDAEASMPLAPPLAVSALLANTLAVDWGTNKVPPLRNRAVGHNVIGADAELVSDGDIMLLELLPLSDMSVVDVAGVTPPAVGGRADVAVPDEAKGVEDDVLGDAGRAVAVAGVVVAATGVVAVVAVVAEVVTVLVVVVVVALAAKAEAKDGEVGRGPAVGEGVEGGDDAGGGGRGA